MSRQDLSLLLIQLSVMAAVALLSGQFMRRLRQPAVLGELMGGILLGPTLFGSLFPDLYMRLFPQVGNVSVAREAVIKLGLLFFLFAAGMEVNLSSVRRRGWNILLASTTGIVIPFGLGWGAVLLFPEMWGPQASGNMPLFAFFLGTALSISALPVIARILIDCNLMKTLTGNMVIAAATIDDLIGWSLFAVILTQFTHPGEAAPPLGKTLGWVFGFFVLTLTVGRSVGRHALNWFKSHLVWPSGFLGISAILVMFAAAFTEALGIHAIFGAFLAGVMLSPVEETRDETHETLFQFVTFFFAAPLYFVSVGQKANFAEHFDLTVVLVVLVVACLGKILGAGLGAWLGGMRPREALAIGFGMNARGAMEMILASVALDYGLIDERIFVALIVTALVTSLMSGPVMMRLLSPSGASRF